MFNPTSQLRWTKNRGCHEKTGRFICYAFLALPGASKNNWKAEGIFDSTSLFPTFSTEFLDPVNSASAVSHKWISLYSISTAISPLWHSLTSGRTQSLPPLNTHHTFLYVTYPIGPILTYIWIIYEDTISLHEHCFFLLDLTILYTRVVFRKSLWKQRRENKKGMKRDLEKNRKESSGMKGEGRKRRGWKIL